MSEAILELRELQYVSDGKKVLDGLNVSLEPGKIYALIGNAGSGKTELLRILAGLQPAAGGEARLFGKPVSDPASRKEVGMLVGEPALCRELSIANNLEMQARITGKRDKRRLGKLMKGLGILPRDTGNRSAGSCPASIRVRLGTALALLAYPKLLLLDEPFSGLDSDDSIKLRDLLLSEMADREMTVLMTAAFFAEVWDTATDFLVLEKGKLAAAYTKNELSAKMPEEGMKSGDLEAFFQSLRKEEQA